MDIGDPPVSEMLPHGHAISVITPTCREADRQQKTCMVFLESYFRSLLAKLFASSASVSFRIGVSAHVRSAFHASSLDPGLDRGDVAAEGTKCMIPFQLHRRTPLVRRPFYQRDTAIAERDRAVRESIRLMAECDELTATLERERAKLRQEIAEHDALRRSFRERSLLDSAGDPVETFHEDLKELLACYQDSPAPSHKVTSYFHAYVELFRHLRSRRCTFVEAGVLNGGSLFMWRSWLGPQARIVGIDLNPQAVRWRSEGFEIHIGDQGDPQFWRSCLEQIGDFDVLLDDGGHQSFQQIVTLIEGIRAVRRKAVVVIEDTCTSFMYEFAYHRRQSFLGYAKDSTDVLTARMAHFFPGQFPTTPNEKVMNAFKSVASIQFFPGIVAFKVDADAALQPELIWNHRPTDSAHDFRYQGATSAMVDWPDPFASIRVTVDGRPI
jgi:hypothetical protein